MGNDVRRESPVLAPENINRVKSPVARPGDESDTCLKIEYFRSGDSWAGIYWQLPESNWGETRGRRVVGARKVSFWARGETGNEWIEFKLGGIGWHLEMGRRFGWFPDRSIRYPDSFYKNDFLRLSNKWQKYEISVRGQNLSNL